MSEYITKQTIIQILKTHLRPRFCNINRLIEIINSQDNEDPTTIVTSLTNEPSKSAREAQGLIKRCDVEMAIEKLHREGFFGFGKGESPQTFFFASKKVKPLLGLIDDIPNQERA